MPGREPGETFGCEQRVGNSDQDQGVEVERQIGAGSLTRQRRRLQRATTTRRTRRGDSTAAKFRASPIDGAAVAAALKDRRLPARKNETTLGRNCGGSQNTTTSVRGIREDQKTTRDGASNTGNHGDQSDGDSNRYCKTRATELIAGTSGKIATNRPAPASRQSKNTKRNDQDETRQGSSSRAAAVRDSERQGRNDDQAARNPGRRRRRPEMTAERRSKTKTAIESDTETTARAILEDEGDQDQRSTSWTKATATANRGSCKLQRRGSTAIAEASSPVLSRVILRREARVILQRESIPPLVYPNF